MAKFDNLAKSFEEGANKAKAGDQGALKRSLAIINAIDKLKRQGIQVTKKAQMDYMLACRFVERASKTAGKDLLAEYRNGHGIDTAPAPPSNGIKRNPKDHPKEFQTALELSRKIVNEVETLKREQKQIPEKLLEEFLLCKRFLDKYT